MEDKYDFNPRKCNSASTLGGSIERNLSKLIISLPTNNEHVKLFEKNLTAGFSCVNTRSPFDSESLLPNVENPDNDNWEDYSYKVCYNLKLDGKEKYSTKRVTSKILKLDENNQYGHAVTKPMPIDSIKKKVRTWREFNLLLEMGDLDDPIGHLIVVDTFYDYKNETQKQNIYNQIYPPIIEKQKILDSNERSVYQLIELYSEKDKGVPRSYRPTPKAHATLFLKKCQLLYLEHLKILIGRAGWKVTKLYAHYTLKQERLKKDFISMNQRYRQTAKNSVEKLLNNSTFGYDCRNNLDNCTFVPIFEELNEVTYLKKYYSLYDQKIYKFVLGNLMKQDTEEQYNDAIQKISKDDPFGEIKRAELHNNRTESLEAPEAFDKKTKKQKRKKITDDWKKTEELMQNNKTKSVMEFDSGSSVKSIAIETNPNVKMTTHFMKGKILML